MKNLLRIFIGWDSRESVAYHVLSSSILRRASAPVIIIPLVQTHLRSIGIYTRERSSLESTEFSLTRFLVPYLSQYIGHSVFMDCDMLCLTDINELTKFIGGDARTCPKESVLVCQHDYVPKQEIKFLGQHQVAYPKKNWSSLMIFNNEKCRKLTPEYINSVTPSDLHQFVWADMVGSLPMEWNYLVSEDNQSKDYPKIVHFTNGTPCFSEYNNCEYSDLWWDEFRYVTSPI